MPSQSSTPPSTPSYPPAKDTKGMLANLGFVSAIVGLLILPEVFCSVAIVLGAYAWRREQGNRGIFVVILGIVCMLLGLYFFAYVTLGDLLFP